MPSETINSISPNFRDDLLNRNLVPFTNVANATGLGLPSTIQLNFPLASESVTTIDDNSNAYRDLHVIMNAYKNASGYEEATISNTGLVGNSNTDFLNGQYAQPSTLEESPLDDSIGGFPYGGLNPHAFLRKQNFYTGCGEREDVSQILFNNSPVTEQICSYLDETGSIRGLPPTTGADIIGTLLTGRQLGYSPDGPEPNYDVRASIVGRILAPTIGDTPLGLIAAQSLLNAFLANAAINLQEETIGRININGLFNKNEDFIVPNYEITVRDGTLGRGLDLFEKLTGSQFLSPNIIGDDASIFTSKNPSQNHSQLLLSKYTGRGQSSSLFKNLQENNKDGRYTPFYEDNRISRKNLGLPEENEYISKNSSFPEITNNLRVGAGDNPTGEFSWINDNKQVLITDVQNLDTGTVLFTNTGLKTNPFDGNIYKNSLLLKTQDLFNSLNPNNSINSLLLGDSEYSKSIVDETQSAVVDGFISKGSAIKGKHSDDGSTPFCRTWTTYKRYNQVRNLQKHSGLYRNNDGTDGNYARFRRNATASVLDDNGFVKISPYNKVQEDIKKYMFSIENLAWSDKVGELPPCEVGNGDPLNPNIRGRIMWFPPYDISFTDNVSVSLDSTQFIGRGEPIYTYNNTERTGTLTFKVIIDHPSYMNEEVIRNSFIDDNAFAAIVAGCDKVPALEYTDISPMTKEQIEVYENVTPETTTNNLSYNKAYNVYFPNDNAEMDLIIAGYENGTSVLTGFTAPDGKHFRTDINNTYPYSIDTGLNTGELSLIQNILNLPDKLNNECPTCKIVINGWASNQGTPKPSQTETKEQINIRLSDDRANNVAEWIRQQIGDQVNDFEDRIIKIIGNRQTGSGLGSQDNLENKKSRVAVVEIKNVDEKSENLTPLAKQEGQRPVTTDYKIKSKYYSECAYFEKLKEIDEFAYKNIRQYIRFFHPAFHSTTPEGFNSRLTFLHQCTRQGPSNVGDKPTNLAFGRPPVCILRIGDFFHTRIMIDNLAISFEPLVWDLNPEGVGVQPMIANIDLSFKILGGQSIQGPINKLQNAVSFNFFANTEIYDMRADSINLKDRSIDAGKPLAKDNEMLNYTFERVSPIEDLNNNKKNEGEIQDYDLDFPNDNFA